MDKDNKENGQSFNDPISWKSLGFFSVEDYLVYVFKKTEKITAALYLVSGLLKDDEPLKWELRDHGMDLLSASFSASSPLPADRNSVIQSLFTAALETISLLNVAKISHLISPMNHTILVREIDQVLAMLRDRLAQSAENAGYVLSDSFFKTPDLFSSGFKSDKTERVDKAGKGGRSADFSKRHADAHGYNSGSDEALSKGQTGSIEKKAERQEHILNLLKDHSQLTIKDFSKVIKDCSAKTIQRELLELVDKGIIKKEGERRWSRYSLK